MVRIWERFYGFLLKLICFFFFLIKVGMVRPEYKKDRMVERRRRKIVTFSKINANPMAYDCTDRRKNSRSMFGALRIFIVTVLLRSFNLLSSENLTELFLEIKLSAKRKVNWTREMIREN